MNNSANSIQACPQTLAHLNLLYLLYSEIYNCIKTVSVLYLILKDNIGNKINAIQKY